jgi:hypothetical protein
VAGNAVFSAEYITQKVAELQSSLSNLRSEWPKIPAHTPNT